MQQTVTAALRDVDLGDAPAVGLFTPPPPASPLDFSTGRAPAADIEPPPPVVRELVYLPARRLRAEVWSNGDGVWSTLTGEDWLRRPVPGAERLSEQLRRDADVVLEAAGCINDDDGGWMTPAFMVAEEVARRLNAAGQNPPAFAADDTVDMEFFWAAFDRVVEPVTRARWFRQDFLEEHR